MNDEVKQSAYWIKSNSRWLLGWQTKDGVYVAVFADAPCEVIQNPEEVKKIEYPK